MGWETWSNPIDGWTPGIPSNWPLIQDDYCTQSSFEPFCTRGPLEYAVSVDPTFPPESTTLLAEDWNRPAPGQFGCNYARVRILDRWGNAGPWSPTATYWIQSREGEPMAPCADNR